MPRHCSGQLRLQGVLALDRVDIGRIDGHLRGGGSGGTRLGKLAVGLGTTIRGAGVNDLCRFGQSNKSRGPGLGPGGGWGSVTRLLPPVAWVGQ